VKNIEVGDWVRYVAEDEEEYIESVVRTNGTGIFTKQSGKYWLTVDDILEVRKKST